MTNEEDHDALQWEPFPSGAIRALNQALDRLEHDRRIAVADLSVALARAEDRYRNAVQAIVVGGPYEPKTSEGG